MTKTHNGIPAYRPDIYTAPAIVEPYPHYRRLCDLGPVVRLPQHRVYALPRYAECKQVLRDDNNWRLAADRLRTMAVTR